MTVNELTNLIPPLFFFGRIVGKRVKGGRSDVNRREIIKKNNYYGFIVMYSLGLLVVLCFFFFSFVLATITFFVERLYVGVS